MIDIIIINYFSENLVEKCVKSILTSDIEGVLFNIIIVDNGSNSSILSQIEGANIKVIKSPKNLGFGAACNLGAKHANNKYVLFLNPDTMVYKNTLKASLDFIENNKEITVLGCKQLDEQGNIHRSCARYITLSKYINHIFKLDTLFPKFFKSYHMSDWNHETSRYVEHVIGAFYMMRKKDFVAVGGFDEAYFVYYEDLDLSKRISDKGGKIYYNSEISIFHKGGGASEKVKAHRLLYALESLLVYSKKYFSKAEVLLLYFFVFFVEPLLRVFHAALKGSVSGVKEVLKAYKMLINKRIFKI